MAHIFHRTSGTAATARGFSLFFIAAHSENDECANGDQNEGNDDGCKVLRNPIEHGKTSFSNVN